MNGHVSLYYEEALDLECYAVKFQIFVIFTLLFLDHFCLFCKILSVSFETYVLKGF